MRPTLEVIWVLFAVVTLLGLFQGLLAWYFILALRDIHTEIDRITTYLAGGR